MRFAAAPEYEVFPSPGTPLKPYVAGGARVGVDARGDPLLRSRRSWWRTSSPSAASLAAQAEGRAWATLVPHVMPTGEPGFPIYSVGAVYPRTALGRRLWARVRPIVMTGEEQGRVELNGARERLGLPPLAETHGGISRDLAIVATFPQLEYPREARWPGVQGHGAAPVGAAVRRRGAAAGRRPARAGGAEHLTGPVAPAGARGARGAGGRAGARAGDDEPARSRRDADRRRRPAERARSSTGSRTRGRCRCATRSSATPATGRWRARSRAACRWWRARTPATWPRTRRAIRWAGAGVSLPRRFVTPRGVRLAVARLLAEPGYRRRAEELRDWASANDGAAAAADAVEELGERASERKSPQSAG